jgi:hypothetical protein
MAYGARKLKQKLEIEAMLHARWERQRLKDASNRALFDALPSCPEKDALKLAMLERAWWLYDGKEGEGDAESRLHQGDALIAFLPEKDVETFLEQFFETANEFNPALYGGS